MLCYAATDVCVCVCVSPTPSHACQLSVVGCLLLSFRFHFSGFCCHIFYVLRKIQAKWMFSFLFSFFVQKKNTVRKVEWTNGDEQDKKTNYILHLLKRRKKNFTNKQTNINMHSEFAYISRANTSDTNGVRYHFGELAPCVWVNVLIHRLKQQWRRSRDHLLVNNVQRTVYTFSVFYTESTCSHSESCFSSFFFLVSFYFILFFVGVLFLLFRLSGGLASLVTFRWRWLFKHEHDKWFSTCNR